MPGRCTVPVRYDPAGLSGPLPREEGPDHCRSVRLLGRRTQNPRIAHVRLRYAMPAAVNGKELHLNAGAVAPEHLLDVIFAGPWGTLRFRRTGDVIEVRKVLPRLPRRPDLAALEQAEELDLSTIEWIQGILRTVHDHDGRSALPRGLAFEALRHRHVRRYRGNGTEAGRSFERQSKRHMAATGSAGRKHAVPIDTDFGDELVGDPRQKSNVVDAQLVRSVITDDVARVPIALVPIGIDDRKALFVRKALEPIPRRFSHVRTVFTRAVHHQHQRRSFLQTPRHIGQVRPLPSAHLERPLGQLAGQPWDFG